MSQATLGDDEELFGEAASEMREDVESSLAQAWSELPAADDVWETDAENALGVLNGLKSALDAGDAEAHLRDAKKWYTMGQRADAFEDADDLEAEIESLEETISDVSAAGEQVGDLASTIPSLRGALQEAEAESEDDGEEAPEATDESDEEDAEQTPAGDETEASEESEE
ncbi:hypothetical protein GWG54_00045 [Natronococcus sp. JC468]|uniref:DUF5790 family protein n=1 Tax=Natronococcus sp. JC468 TaxID=1961921 RepID=UPI00143A44F7|nr:DUF5790 family protein [Natronococcus sp. JC468]NKE34229.1 hypothetical protein [Natronococcus sp. JC468]